MGVDFALCLTMIVDGRYTDYADSGCSAVNYSLIHHSVLPLGVLTSSVSSDYKESKTVNDSH